MCMTKNADLCLYQFNTCSEVSAQTDCSPSFACSGSTARIVDRECPLPPYPWFDNSANKLCHLWPSSASLASLHSLFTNCLSSNESSSFIIITIINHHHDHSVIINPLNQHHHQCQWLPRSDHSSNVIIGHQHHNCNNNHLHFCYP